MERLIFIIQPSFHYELTPVISVQFAYIVSKSHDWSLAGVHQSVRNIPPFRPDWLLRYEDLG